ncbi:hypothetical protein PoB_004567400 [Plakobranchus ocellatus]|uniref:Uncharacterized protein n=1 Tax=Plakobranchus ocellatus TaxID=259542 RepID=A0AAV4BLH8_9GAST|nr:hypothetical protein PoB_004567400 [Plakobranchus ocellatus]
MTPFSYPTNQTRDPTPPQLEGENHQMDGYDTPQLSHKPSKGSHSSILPTPARPNRRSTVLGDGFFWVGRMINTHKVLPMTVRTMAILVMLNQFP